MNIKTVVVGPLAVNCLILEEETQHRAVIIDPGDDAEWLLGALKEDNMTLVAILHTHGHFDHVGASGAVARATGAPVYLHQEDHFIYEGAAYMARGFGLTVETPPPVDHWMKDEELLDFGGDLKIQVIHTPGHSPGSVSFRLDIQGKTILIAGDVLFQGSIGRTDIPGGDMDTLMRSIETRLLIYPEDSIVIPGHGPTTTIGAEKLYNPFLADAFR